MRSSRQQTLTSGRREPRPISSTIHPDRVCNQCILCKRQDFSKYSHPKTWKNSSLLHQLQTTEPFISVELDSCICLACRKDVSRIGEDGFVPRWKRNINVKQCYVKNCKNSDIKITKQVSVQEVDELFSVEHDNIQTSNVDDIPLCSHHYLKWYKFTHMLHDKCKLCSKKIYKYSDSRPIPEPDLLVNINVQVNEPLEPEDRLCYPCYKSLTITIKHSKNVVTSSDTDLNLLLVELKHNKPTLLSVKTLDNAINYTVYSLAIDLGEHLLQQTAVLLPHIYTEFKLKLCAVSLECGVQVEDENLPNSIWLRSTLSSLLEHHMAYKCCIRKLGTILYRYGGDLLHALTVSLSQHTPPDTDTTSDDINITQTCKIINQKLRTQADELIKFDSQKPHIIEEFNVDNFIKEIDPTIWKALCVMTESPRNEKTFVKRVRTVFLICQMLFTVNRKCSFPLHTLVTDAIDTFGGSARLKALLNRLGVCASCETHARYVQYRVEKKQKEGPLHGKALHYPVIVSADNLDYKQMYSRVYCGNQGIGWHGTTVQITTRFQNSTQAESILEPIDCNIFSKRLYSTRSPHKQRGVLTSPKPKKARRSRTGIETKHLEQADIVPIETIQTSPIEVPTANHGNRESLLFENFEIQNEEKEALNILKSVCTEYIMLKVANTQNPNSMIGLQMYYCLSENVPCPDKSSILYFKVLDEKCDNKETLLSIINDLYVEFILSRKKTHIILEGDQATYERLHSIRAEYGSESNWLILLPGDWHFLKNYQEVLIKIYFEGGLSDLARASGYLPRSIGTNFKRTHRFLLESWEALYRVLMDYFLSKSTPPDFLNQVATLLKNIPPSLCQENAHRNLKELLENIKEIVGDNSQFEAYMYRESKNNPSLLFWTNYLLRDCLAYIALYLSIRTGNWYLRMGALKLMCPLFTSYDRPKYAKLIPLYIKEMLSIPVDLLSYLKEGGFTVSILGRSGHSVAIDECHEMSINKDSKDYIVRPTADNMTRLAIFLPIRAKAITNLEEQIFADSNSSNRQQLNTISIHTNDTETKKHEANVLAQIRKIELCNKVLPTLSFEPSSSNTLSHLFNNKTLKPEQVHDLSSFWEKGLDAQNQYINYYILRKPSIKPPKHKKALLTFTEKHARQKKGTQVEKEHKLQLEIWKKRVSFAATTGFKDNMTYKQCIVLPRAIATTDGNPIKGAKSNITKVYEKRYEKATPQIITTEFPQDWSPQVVVEEGMFLININPWSSHKTMAEYGHFLLKQHILPYLKNENTLELHLLFDSPNAQKESPKYFEQQRRDCINQIPDDHTCAGFSEDMLIPPKWRQEVINCRKCKYNLVHFLSDFFLQKIRYRLKPNQKFVTAGGLSGSRECKAMFVTRNSPPTIDETLTSNAEESDTRIWLHVINSHGTKKLVLSPDTDVYHIGLRVVEENPHINVLVRLSPFSAIEQKLLNIPVLLTHFKNDPDLATAENSKIAHIIQVLFVSTGCDYISFFNGLGKATFMKTLFRYCEFITGTNISSICGTLTNETNGFLSFLRLIGCAYFMKHKTAFLPSFSTPMTLFNSIQPNTDQKKQHDQWLDAIRNKMWTRIQFEEDMLPSTDALVRHWKRSCWVLSVWEQSTRNNIVHPPLEDFGWRKSDQDTLMIDWDSEDNSSNIRQQVALFKKGCTCKTGCSSARCRCRKQSNHCSHGCKCIGCTNLPMEDITNNLEEVSDSDRESNTSSTEFNHDIDNIMLKVFGQCESESNKSHSTRSIISEDEDTL